MVGVWPGRTGGMIFEANIGGEKRIVTLRGAKLTVKRFVSRDRRVAKTARFPVEICADELVKVVCLRLSRKYAR